MTIRRSQNPYANYIDQCAIVDALKGVRIVFATNASPFLKRLRPANRRRGHGGHVRHL